MLKTIKCLRYQNDHKVVKFGNFKKHTLGASGTRLPEQIKIKLKIDAQGVS